MDCWIDGQTETLLRRVRDECDTRILRWSDIHHSAQLKLKHFCVEGYLKIPQRLTARQHRTKLQHGLRTKHHGYTTSATVPHPPHPLRPFYGLHCRTISSVDMTREKSQGQSRANQTPDLTHRAAVLRGSS